MNYPAPEKISKAITAESGLKYFYLPENKQEIEPKLRSGLFAEDGKLSPQTMLAIGAIGAAILAGYAIYSAAKKHKTKGKR